MRKWAQYGGIAAALVLIVFGIAAIIVGSNGRNTVNSSLKEQKIVGTPDMTPAGIKAEAQKAGLDVATITFPTCSVANQPVTEATRARCFAQYMKIHALEATGGQLYSQMPRYATANGKGTNEVSEALVVGGKPVENAARNVWVQETALSTALNTSYMASQIATFGVVVGIAMILSGIGFAVLVIGGALNAADKREPTSAPAQSKSPAPAV
ncbi:MAG TPA: hypothetical protein VMA83_05245 [Solirubrobacteraceae bacterium]|nr:hypothetical protein [Solirubrobacteraceae bacterium]